MIILVIYIIKFIYIIYQINSIAHAIHGDAHSHVSKGMLLGLMVSKALDMFSKKEEPQKKQEKPINKMLPIPVV